MNKVVAINKDWWKVAEQEAASDLRTHKILERTFLKRAEQSRAKRKVPGPIAMEKHYPITHWHELLGFPESSIRLWCRSEELRGRWIKGEWRISESAMNAFLEDQEKKRG